MEISIVGLGRMGANIARRLLAGGHRVVGYDKENVGFELKEDGMELASTLSDLIQKTNKPKKIWLMLPAGKIIDDMIDELMPSLDNDSILIDGGNSNYKDTLNRHARLKSRDISFLDVGTSGGIWGKKDGYCMMIGGAEPTIQLMKPIFETLAPTPTSGWGRVGPAGSGHFVKMIHNGIEYGIMEAFAEGFSILRQKSEFDLDLPEIAKLWNEGSVIRSWLLELIARALDEDPNLSSIGPKVDDSGEGRWAVEEAVALDVAAPIITLSLITRLQSRDPDAFSYKVLAALRQQFGGHDVAAGE